MGSSESCTVGKHSSGVIIGAAGGIGSATAKALAGTGARILLADLDTEKVGKATLGWAGEIGQVMVSECDIRELQSVEQVRDRLLDWTGRVDFMVLATGVTEWGGIGDGDPGRWREVVETNILGTANVLRTFEAAITRARGHAVIVASLSGREVYAGQPVYIASKWAAIGLSHSVRREWQAKGARVTVIAPGLVDTQMSRRNPFASPLFERLSALSPHDVASAVEFALRQPRSVLVREIQMQPVGQEI